MKSIALASLLFFTAIASAEKARAAPTSKGDRLDANVRKTINEHCGSCHDGARSTAKPAAIKIFDLREKNWTARMADEQFKIIVSRMKGKDASARQQNEVVQFVEMKLSERAARRARPEKAAAEARTPTCPEFVD